MFILLYFKLRWAGGLISRLVGVADAVFTDIKGNAGHLGAKAPLLQKFLGFPVNCIARDDQDQPS